MAVWGFFDDGSSEFGFVDLGLSLLLPVIILLIAAHFVGLALDLVFDEFGRVRRGLEVFCWIA